VWLWLLRMQPRLHSLVLAEEVAEIRNEVPDDVHVGQRIDRELATEFLERLETGQAVIAVHIHRAGAADAFTTGAAERQRRIDLVLDLDERIQDHRTALVHVDPVSIELWLAVLARYPAVD